MFLHLIQPDYTSMYYLVLHLAVDAAPKLHLLQQLLGCHESNLRSFDGTSSLAGVSHGSAAQA